MPLVIVGAGGHGRVVLDAATANAWSIAGFIDGALQGVVNGHPILGGPDLLDGDFLIRHRFVVAIGNQQARRRLACAISEGGGELATIIHPAAWISPSACIGTGTVVIGGAVVNANARIGDYCILNTGCSVDHDNLLEDGVQVCPGARLAGNVTCGEDAFIGTGASIIPGIVISERAVVGAGSVVVRDVPGGTTVVGNPARRLIRPAETAKDRTARLRAVA